MAARAADDLNQKLRLEAAFLPKLNAYGRQIIQQIVQRYAREGMIVNVDEFNPALKKLLQDQYDLVGNVFGVGIRGDLPNDVAITDEEGAAIAAALLLFFKDQSTKRSELIDETTNADIKSAFADAQAEAITKGEIAVIAGALFSRAFRGRASGIALTETQFAAESAKLTEGEVLAGVKPTVTGGTPQQSVVTKEWVSVGDSKVREAHVEADGQITNVNEPFTVGGQQLMYPGDGSLGAGPENIINCRCSSEIDETAIIANRRAKL